MLARVGVLGDLHAEDERLVEGLRFFAARTVDAVFAVGDIVDGPGDAARCIELLRAHDVTCVAGNHERWFVAGTMRDLPDATPQVPAHAMTWLAALPKTRRLDTAGGELLLCHGVGDDDMVVLTADSSAYDIAYNEELRRIMLDGRTRFMICGHTHRRMLRRFGDLVVVNAGTLLRQHDPCVAIVDFERGEAEWFDFDAGGRLP